MAETDEELPPPTPISFRAIRSEDQSTQGAKKKAAKEAARSSQTPSRRGPAEDDGHDERREGVRAGASIRLQHDEETRGDEGARRYADDAPHGRNGRRTEDDRR